MKIPIIIISVVALLMFGAIMDQENRTQKSPAFNAVLKQAKESNKNIFIYFGASWCPPCKIMKSQVLVDDSVIDILDTNYITIIIDTDENKDLSLQFNVSGIPCFMIVDSNGEILKRHSGIITPNKMVDWLSL